MSAPSKDIGGGRDKMARGSRKGGGHKKVAKAGGKKKPEPRPPRRLR